MVGMTPEVSPPSNYMLAFCSPLYEDVAINEMGTLLATRLTGRLAQGALLLASDCRPRELFERLAAHPPVFTRQVIVNVAAVPRSATPALDAHAIAEMRQAAVFSNLLVCDCAGRCPPELAVLRAALAPMVRPEQGGAEPLAVVADAENLYTGTAIVGAGISSAPPWPAGRPDFRYDAQLVSRSALKLMEAIDLFRIPVVARSLALDLGAAPGGWSQVLARRGATVIAVDPGELDPRVTALDGVRVFTGTAATFIRHATARFDLIVNDMRLDARESARTMLEARSLLQRGGAMLMTLKLPERAPTAVMRQALEILHRVYSRPMARCLYFNRNEVTVYAQS